MAEDGKALATVAKERGNACFAKKSREGYKEALGHYKEAIGHDPDNHVLHANSAACHIELAGDEWEPKKKVEAYARALISARQCVSLAPTWAKGYVRQSAAEFELLGASVKWEERKAQDEKFRKEDEEEAAKDPAYESFRQAPENAELDLELKQALNESCYGSCEAACRRGLDLEAGNETLRARLQSLRDSGHTTDTEKDRAMRQPEAAAKIKAEGNAAFSAKHWTQAAEHYTKALAQDPFDHVFYSNRSACHAESEGFQKALQDAERCIELKPDFAKGYSRHALALFHLGRYPEMEAAAKKGLQVDPANAGLQDLLKQAQAETSEPAEVQRHMHKLREDKRKDQKMQSLMQNLNMGGQNFQMFNGGGGGDISQLLAGLGGGGGGGYGGMGGMGGLGGSGKSRMTEEQMRGTARAMAQAPPASSAPSATAASPEAKPVSPASTGPTSFTPAK